MTQPFYEVPEEDLLTVAFHEEMGAAAAGPGPEPGGVRVTPWRRLAEEGPEGCSVFERVVHFSTPVEAPALVRRAIGVDSIPVADTVRLFLREDELAAVGEWVSSYGGVVEAVATTRDFMHVRMPSHDAVEAMLQIS